MKIQVAERNGSDLCLACGMCCNGVLHSEVMVLADEVKTYAPEFDIEQHPGQPQFYFEQPCRHLAADNRCRIYDKGRPFGCGAYACKLLNEYLDGRRELEDCLKIIAEARRQTSALSTEQERKGESPFARPNVWDYVGAFLAGNFEQHEGALVDFRALDAETLHKVARLSFHLGKYFISPGERGVSKNNENPLPEQREE